MSKTKKLPRRKLSFSFFDLSHESPGSLASSDVRFIALVLKTTILKYGGPLLLARLRPIFLGLILGEASVGGFWVVVDAFTGMQSNTLRGVFFG